MKKARLYLSIVVLTAMLFSSCGGDESNEVKIGKHVWMTENLNVDKFSNGDAIPQAKSKEEWKKADENKQPAWCYYDNDLDNGEKYGRLYNWHAVNDPRGLAPKGWKIPSDADWSHLVDFLGGESVAGKKMKFSNFWADKNDNSGSGNDESRFSGLPGGDRFFNGEFFLIGESAYWWSSSEFSTLYSWGLFLNNYDEGAYIFYELKGGGMSVRCIRE